METIGDKGTEESIRAAKRSSLISRDWEEWDVEMFGWKTKGWDNPSILTTWEGKYSPAHSARKGKASEVTEAGDEEYGVWLH